MGTDPAASVTTPERAHAPRRQRLRGRPVPASDDRLAEPDALRGGARAAPGRPPRRAAAAPAARARLHVAVRRHGRDASPSWQQAGPGAMVTRRDRGRDGHPARPRHRPVLLRRRSLSATSFCGCSSASTASGDNSGVFVRFRDPPAPRTRRPAESHESRAWIARGHRLRGADRRARTPRRRRPASHRRALRHPDHRPPEPRRTPAARRSSQAHGTTTRSRSSGDTYRVRLNGHLTATYTNPDPAAASAPTMIRRRVHRPAAAHRRVSFRAVRIKPGPSDPDRARPTEPATAATQRPMRVLHLTTEFPPVIYGGLGTAVGGWVTASARAGMTMGVHARRGRARGRRPGRAARYGAARGPSGPRRARRARSKAARERSSTATGSASSRASWAEATEAGRPARAPMAARHRAPAHRDGLASGAGDPGADRQAARLPRALRRPRRVRDRPRAPAMARAQPRPGGRDRPRRPAHRALAATSAICSPPTTPRPATGSGSSATASTRPHCTAPAARRRPPDGPAMVLYSGRLVERKGIRELLGAIPRVLARRARHALRPGRRPATAHRCRGRRPVAHAGAGALPRPQIHFTGWLSPAELADWYRAADVLVVPSRYEPFGMVILEGMLHGLPIVSSDVGGPAEILDARPHRAAVPTTRRRAAWPTRSRHSCATRRSAHASAARGAVEVRRSWTWPNRVARMRDVYRRARAGAPRRRLTAPTRRHDRRLIRRR